MTANRKRTRKPKHNAPDVLIPPNKPKTRRERDQERATTKNGQDRLVRLFVAMPEEQAARLLACTRMYYGTPDVPLFGKYANQTVLFGIDKMYHDLENTYAFSQFWHGIRDAADEEIRGVK